MRYFVLLFLLPVMACVTSGFETCRTIILSGIGDADGTYAAPTDYRGRPDFFREDGTYNLFGEEDLGTCYWRVDSALSEFPFWRTYDCSYHPIDIESEWFVNVNGLDPKHVSINILCEDPEPNQVWKVYVVPTMIFVVVVALVVYGHLLCRKNRIKKSKRECAVCRLRTNEAAKVVTRAFNRRPSIT